jgi:DNA-3-methyladenine glycosylase II
MPISAQKMKSISATICEIDPKFEAVVSNNPLCTIGRADSEESNFQSLVSSVVSQQLSGKAASTIHGRLQELVGGEITPQKIALQSVENLRAVGLSGAKAKTILGLTDSVISGLSIEELHNFEDAEILRLLTEIWGIGEWTVHMFMIFQIGHLDIWPTGDLGVRKGWELIHNSRKELTPKELGVKGEKLRPYRSVVAWYCWRALDNR